MSLQMWNISWSKTNKCSIYCTYVCIVMLIICIPLSSTYMENQMALGWQALGGDADIKSSTHYQTDRVHVWTSLALGSNNCILDVSKHGILSALWWDWAVTLPGERYGLDLPWLAKALGLFAPWANCVYYHTFLGSVQYTAVKQAGCLSKPLFPGVKSCHLRMCHFCLSALSHLLAHFAWAGEICATCHCLPGLAVGLMEHILGEGDDKWQGLYIILRGKKGRWPLINTIFTHWAEKRQGWFYFWKCTLYLSHATVNKQKTEKINFT